MTKPVCFIYTPKFLNYRLAEGHPLNPLRLQMTYEMLNKQGLLSPPRVEVVEPRSATEAEILTSHEAAYIHILNRLNRNENVPEIDHFGLGPGDTPAFPGILDAALLYCGGSLTAAEKVLSGAPVAFNIAGGLHHAMRDHASGFCVLNDAVIAIHRLLRDCTRVMYVDIDAHHGDGVQAAFYDTDRVFTISIHESGDSLFPGTGYEDEIGTGAGRGYSVNVPLPAESGDDTYIAAFDRTVPDLLASYRPDILVAQLGADAYVTDPLTHLRVTERGFGHVFRAIAGFGVPTVALGGGGYDIHAVARVWTMAFAILSGQAPGTEAASSKY